MMKTLFLQPPSFDGFDGGAGSRYQARREIKSFWFPTWLAQPAALVPSSKLIDAPPAKLSAGCTATLAPTKPIFSAGFASFNAAATFTSDANDGVEVWITQSSCARAAAVT